MEVQTYNPSTWESVVVWATQQTQRRKTRKEGKRQLVLKRPTSFPYPPRLCEGLDWAVCSLPFPSPQDKVSPHSPSYPPTFVLHQSSEHWEGLTRVGHHTWLWQRKWWNLPKRPSSPLKSRLNSLKSQLHLTVAFRILRSLPTRSGVCSVRSGTGHTWAV